MPAPRAHAWLSLASLLTQLTLIGIGSYLIDESGLEQGAGSWGYVFAFVVITALYASWPVLATLVCAVVASASRSDVVARRAAVTGAVFAALTGLAGLLLGLLALLTSRDEAGTVFGLVARGGQPGRDPPADHRVPAGTRHRLTPLRRATTCASADGVPSAFLAVEGV